MIRLILGLALYLLAGVVLVPGQEPPRMTTIPKNSPPFEYVDVGGKIPDYKRGPGKTQTLMQKPLAPADSMKHVVHPVEFELQLFASEELLGGGKPICINWDEQGRAWVAVTVDYPNQLGKNRDRILILEDADGDGRADRVKVFADRLSIPTSLTFARGGVIVHQPPHTLFLQDTNGDDTADHREILFTGWGTGDTHAGPSNLVYGFDNWIYGIVGYSGFNGTVGGEKHRFGQGFYRFRSDGSKLEFLRSTSNNSWGVGFSEDGDLFGSTANGNPSMHLAIPNRYYEKVRGWSAGVLGTIGLDTRFYPITDRVRQVDFHGRFTAAAGHALYTARAYPRAYWNRTAFVAEPTGHLVATFTLEQHGSTYRSRNSWNLVAGQDEWFAPVMAEVGPDSNVWVIDWYSYIVQHNPTPPGFRTGKGNAYETDLRDTKLGRIYRLAVKGARPAPRLSLKGASGEKLVAALKHDNLFWRRHAQRLIVETRDKFEPKLIVPALVTLVKDRSVDEIGLNVGAIHALWTLHGIGALDGSHPDAVNAVVSALQHPSAAVRRTAVQVLPAKEGMAEAIGNAGLLKDADSRVRLAALLALAGQPGSPGVADALVAVLADDAFLQDRGLADALTIYAAAQADQFLPALARKWDRPLTGDRAVLVERVAEHHGRGAPVDAVGPLLEALAGAQGTVADAVVAGLARGWPRQQPPRLTEASEKLLAGLLGKLSPAGRGRLVTLAGIWGSKALDRYGALVASGFLAQVANVKETDINRIQAAAQLIEFRRTDLLSAQEVLKLLTPTASPELARGLLDAVGRSEAAGVGAALIDRVPSLTPAVKPAAVRNLLGRADWTELLLDAAEKGTFSLAELSLDQKQGLASHPNKKIAARARILLAKGGSLPSADRQKVIDELMPGIDKPGDADIGKLVFKNHCAKCHIHGTEGNKIGPDLTGMAVHPKHHLLVEIIDPSRSVEGNYRQYVVTTKTGRVLSGLLASESKTAIELIDGEAKKQTILRDDIDEVVASAKSFMPDGFEKQLKTDELVNLLEFLTRRGKYLPLPLEKVASAVSTKGMFHSEESKVERLVFRDWAPKTFQGVPFQLVDPQGNRVPNVLLMYGPEGKLPPKMPRSAKLPCNSSARTIHLLSGVSGWGFPLGPKGSVSLIVRLHYADGTTEDHELKNGEHFADYIRRVDVPGSQFAFDLDGRQVRYLAVTPRRPAVIREIELVKGPDRTAPIVMAVTVEIGEP
jgi:hypothetical protein